MNDLKDNNVEDILAGVPFDENGLPILNENRSSQNTEDNHHILIPLKKDDEIIDAKTYHINPEPSKPIPKAIPKAEISDEQIFKSIIKRTKKQPITVTVKHTVITVDPTVLTVINDSVQCETEEDKLELLFEEIYDRQEVKRQIFEEFKKIYKKKD